MPSQSRSPQPPDGKGPDYVHPVIRPKPAGTLLILDNQHGRPCVLMGCRHKAHTFMPGVFVFPGGKVDAQDNAAPFDQDLTASTIERLQRSGPKQFATERRARAFALAAIRETFEEVGLLVGQPVGNEKSKSNALWEPFLSHGQIADLQNLRFVARAVTPPKLVRRYDTRFFTVPREAVNLELADSPTNELSDLTWVPLDGVSELNIPWITGQILSDVAERVRSEGTIDLSDKVQIPSYGMRNGKRSRLLI